jgi:hypothetical protein
VYRQEWTVSLSDLPTTTLAAAPVMLERAAQLGTARRVRKILETFASRYPIITLNLVHIILLIDN